MKQKQFKIVIYVVGGLLIINLIIIGYWSVLVDLAPVGQDQLRVIFFDVGQGDAILIQTPQKQNILVDGGPDKSIVYKLDKYIPITRRRIDLMILTHADLDHLTGLVETLRRYKVNSIIDNGVEDSTLAYTQWRGLIQQKNISRTIVNGPKTFILGDELSIQFLWPHQDLIKESFGDDNFTSIVFKLIYNDISFVFTSDATHETEQALIETNYDLSADVLKAGHHGSKYSSGIEFLNMVKPIYGTISVGAENRFGHPSLRVLKNLTSIGTHILRTDEKGDIIFISDGQNLESKTEK